MLSKMVPVHFHCKLFLNKTKQEKRQNSFFLNGNQHYAVDLPKHVLNLQYSFKPHLCISEVIFLLIYEVYHNMNS